MGRAGLLLASVALALGVSACSEEPPRMVGATAFGAVTLDRVVQPPNAKFTRTMYATSRLSRSTMMLDMCRGPVAIDLGGDRPVLIA
ncbi:hypothetical protein, partial [Aeromicrobium sp.]|uniref:hypothetical protein n=1 Tax=Aeromicrobium sp. TaxID=1871063 RepID=UPI003C4F69A7